MCVAGLARPAAPAPDAHLYCERSPCPPRPVVTQERRAFVVFQSWGPGMRPLPSPRSIFQGRANPPSPLGDTAAPHPSPQRHPDRLVGQGLLRSPSWREGGGMACSCPLDSPLCLTIRALSNLELGTWGAGGTPPALSKGDPAYQEGGARGSGRGWTCARQPTWGSHRAPLPGHPSAPSQGSV